MLKPSRVRGSSCDKRFSMQSGVDILGLKKKTDIFYPKYLSTSYKEEEEYGLGTSFNVPGPWRSNPLHQSGDLGIQFEA